MSIIDEALKKLGGETAKNEATPFFKQSTASSIPDMKFVVAPRKRRPISFFLAVALAGTGIIVYLFLPKETAQPARKTQTDIPVAAMTPLSIPTQRTAAIEISSIVADAELTAPPPAWYESGWDAAKMGKWTDAFANWEDGIRGLPEDRMIIISNSYTNLDQFSSALNQHAKMFPAIGVREHFSGQVLYRVIIFPYGGGSRQALPKIFPRVQNLFPRSGLVNASHVQKHLTASSLSSAAKSVPETAREEIPGADQKSLPDPKQSAVKSETINSITTDTAANAGDWETRSATVRDQLKEENYLEVSKNAQSLTHDFPERWETWFWLGTAQIAQGQMDAAETALERASNLNPKVSQIWVQRAIVAQERGDHAAAVKLLNEARELSPKSPQIYLNLGYSNDALGLTAEADKNYLHFLSLTEGDSAYALQRKPIIKRLESRH